MKGLELSRAYWQEACRPILEKDFPQIMEHLAVGLVGDGSECFGWDDQISQDHAWGPRLMFWLSESDAKEFGPTLRQVMLSFPAQFRGYHAPEFSRSEQGRSGLMTIDVFYTQFIGIPRAPETSEEWLTIPESRLAAVCNGEIFWDGCGKFSETRSKLLSYFPEDVRLRKLAQHAAAAAQTGQYNMPRCLLRNEDVAAEICKVKFMENIISMMYLLNRRYCPFYKWAFHGAKELPLLSEDICPMLEELSDACFRSTLTQLTEKISALIIKELHRQGLTSSGSDFLLEHVGQLLVRMQDTSLASRPISMII